jgi:hypothetical protein
MEKLEVIPEYICSVIVQIRVKAYLTRRFDKWPLCFMQSAAEGFA